MSKLPIIFVDHDSDSHFQVADRLVVRNGDNFRACVCPWKVVLPGAFCLAHDCVDRVITGNGEVRAGPERVKIFQDVTTFRHHALLDRLHGVKENGLERLWVFISQNEFAFNDDASLPTFRVNLVATGGKFRQFVIRDESLEKRSVNSADGLVSIGKIDGIAGIISGKIRDENFQILSILETIHQSVLRIRLRISKQEVLCTMKKDLNLRTIFTRRPTSTSFTVYFFLQKKE